MNYPANQCFKKSIQQFVAEISKIMIHVISLELSHIKTVILLIIPVQNGLNPVLITFGT